MNDYTWVTRPGRLVRYVGRNPLVRPSDRLEAWTVLIAVVVAILTIPFAAAIGTALHDQQVQLSVSQVAGRHTVAATVIADGALDAQPGGARFGTPIRWSVGTTSHTGWLNGTDQLQAGDTATVWVDDHGNQVGPPLSREQASIVAVGTAALTWLVVVAVLYAAVRVFRWRLDLIRSAEWSREWENFDRDGNGRRKHRHT